MDKLFYSESYLGGIISSLYKISYFMEYSKEENEDRCAMKMKYRTEEDIFKYIEKCEGIKVVYGVTFAKRIIEENIFKIDYFCDRREGGIGKNIENIPVITVSELNEIISKSGERAFILICVGPNKAAVQSIYGDLCRNDVDADVFDYFAYKGFFLDRTFLYRGQKFNLFENIYNCGFLDTRMTERSVELALGEFYLEKCEGGGYMRGWRSNAILST